MSRNYGKIFRATAAVALLTGAQLVSAATVFDFVANAPSTKLHSFSMTADGITADVSAWAIRKSDEKIKRSELKNYGSWGTGICGPGDGSSCANPSHAADNKGSHRDLFLIEFSEAVVLDRARITEWGEAKRPYVSDSDVSFWAGTGPTGMIHNDIFAPTAPRHDDEIFSGDLSDGDWRMVDLSPAGGPVEWLMIGAVFDDADEYRDFFKLQGLKVSAVPVPAAVWLFGSGLLGLAGFAHRRNASLG